MDRLAKFFLEGEQLVDCIRQECGLPLDRGKEYKDYLREKALREVKSVAVWRMTRVKVNYQL